jgi:pimeloyl-ACP methyl ester carboxylesterase
MTLTVLRAALRSAALLSPRLAGRWLYRLWFTTHRSAEPEREARWRHRGTTVAIAGQNGPLSLYRWGEGPCVLLLHGWNGRGTQMGAFAAPLVQAGYCAVALDAPGHGRSPGGSTTIFEIIDAVERVADAVGPLAGVITHSFGAMVIARALRDGLPAARVVCIAPPARLAFLVDSFCRSVGAPVAARADLVRRLERRFGNDIERQIAADTNAAGVSVPALIIHDRDDADVPWQQAELLAKAWPGARLLLTRGLGHMRILRNRDVIQTSVDFIAGKPA